MADPQITVTGTVAPGTYTLTPVVAPAPPPPPPPPPPVTGFSGGATKLGPLTAADLGSYNYTGGVQAADRLQGVASPARVPGRPSVRVECRSGDGGGGNDRTEYSATHTLWHPGEEWWFALSFLLDSNPAAGVWEIVHQFFAANPTTGAGGGSPPLAVEVTPSGALVLDVRGGPKVNATDAAPRSSAYRLGDSTPRAWHDLLIHAKFSTGPDGLTEAWHRLSTTTFPATPQVSTAGVNVITLAGTPLPVYAETGIYRARMAATQVCMHGGLWARTTRTDAEKFWG